MFDFKIFLVMLINIQAVKYSLKRSLKDLARVNIISYKIVHIRKAQLNSAGHIYLRMYTKILIPILNSLNI